MKKKVSIITPTYNRPRWLTEAIDSVLAQTYPDIEIIVVNDGSTDDTEQILEPYMDKIVYIYKENNGQGAAVNTGIEAATGEYICRVDDDDLFAPEKIELQVEKFEQNPELGLVASDNYTINSEGEILDTKEIPDFSKQGVFLTLLQNCIFCQPTVMVRKECLDKVGLYKSIFAEDYDMWIRITRHYPVGVIHKPLARYRKHDRNLSGRDSLDKKNKEIQKFICEIMDDVSLEELLPGELCSVPHAHDIRGAVFLRHSLYKRARNEFYEAVKFEPQDMVHRFWSGILLRRMALYNEVNECFSKIPPGHRLYDDAQEAIELTSRAQTIHQNVGAKLTLAPENAEALDPEDEDVLRQLRKDLSKEFNKLMNTTIDMATGQLQ